MRKVSYIITAVNILFQIVYMTIGRKAYDELGVLNHIFYVFRPEYMIISGIVVLFNLFILAAVLIYLRKVKICDIAVIILNLQYLVFYRYFLSIQ